MFQSLFKKKKVQTNVETPIQTNEEFWHWFQSHANDFYNVVKNQGDIKHDFFNLIAPKLNQLREGYWFLAGICDDHTAELIITADSVCKNIVFVEELVQSAPQIDHWKITALKPGSEKNASQIKLKGLLFSEDNLSFYSVDHAEFPDIIDIRIVYADCKEGLSKAMLGGITIFLDNYLGELIATTAIDCLEMIGSEEAEKVLIPISKLRDFLIWRQKEFIEKYDGIRCNTEGDRFSSLEGTLQNGKPLLAIVNSTLLDWDGKASHSWILTVDMSFDGNEHGMPTKSDYDLMNSFEDEIMAELKDSDGYLNVGRETADGVRRIYFACTDFRLPSKVLTKMIKQYGSQLQVDYDIYKDKYWMSFNRFIPEIE